MSRPTTKADLEKQAQENFEKLLKLADEKGAE
ncbi:ClbS/DfsB family four-helix bundle protein [Candidatus Saccharibacteria bacterium]|nr:ClbS/DfsB family four-helix bundle protein [Candidatus Saccharibacteria bacterium]MCL1963092.1 ClbS/DfsB family four-helix bundle protein [Candidatus Saccharibacteria bacterium]